MNINKILASLFLLVFISGCTDLSDFVEKVPKTFVQEIEKTPEKIQDKFVMYIGDEVMVGEKLIIVKDIQTNGEVTLFVEGIEEVIETTKNPEIINELEITTEELGYGSEKSEYNVKLKIFPFKTRENEYYLKINEKLEFGDISIVFKDLNKIKGAKVLIEEKEFLIPLEETLIVRNIKITNKRAFNDAFRNKRSAVLHIETLN